MTENIIVKLLQKVIRCTRFYAKEPIYGICEFTIEIVFDVFLHLALFVIFAKYVVDFILNSCFHSSKYTRLVVTIFVILASKPSHIVIPGLFNPATMLFTVFVSVSERITPRFTDPILCTTPSITNLITKRFVGLIIISININFASFLIDISSVRSFLLEFQLSSFKLLGSFIIYNDTIQPVGHPTIRIFTSDCTENDSYNVENDNRNELYIHNCFDKHCAQTHDSRYRFFIDSEHMSGIIITSSSTKSNKDCIRNCNRRGHTQPHFSFCCCKFSRISCNNFIGEFTENYFLKLFSERKLCFDTELRSHRIGTAFQSLTSSTNQLLVRWNLRRPSRKSRNIKSY